MGDPARPLEVIPAAQARPAPRTATTLPIPLPHPGVEFERGNAPLNAIAVRFGSALGIVHAKTRQLKSQSTQLRQRLAVMRTQAQEQGLTAAAQWRRTGGQKAAQLRHSVLKIADEKPLYVIAGAAGAAFVLGFTLQMRRSSHARR